MNEKLTDDQVKQAWHKEWADNPTIESSASFIGKRLRHQRLMITRKMLRKIGKLNGFEQNVIDMGCGGGTTLTVIRNSGFSNSIGIDFDENALLNCERLGYKIGRDVFLLDAKNTNYPDRYFSVGFEEGLWEHFEDPEPFIVEACRITDKWLLAIQPDHFSFFGGLLHWAWEIFNGGGVREYSFPMSYFIEKMHENGFVLNERRATQLNMQAILLFRRIED